ncbi:hypothetical protein ACFP7A_01920 [Sporolactobacillus kofuensis]|uniref:PepSY domain-containing protein n=1 Tax=Sporolactobacillus kofuensis TaxID=269672 RepID=A0ABW1WAX9_9BACL|nr:hypothetical protein [Sporolactobacillus kofuensis]MCO7175907.1 hypothetical protein [Sporolactobacillus kofuensis]
MSNRLGAAIVVGTITGYLAGIATCQFINKKGSLSSENVLARVKKAVSEQWPINGAWIYLSPQSWSKDDFTHFVYKGGLTSDEDGIIHHFDFVADAHTGSLLELKAQ